MKDFLNNPKTMDATQVLRALKIRHLNNATDLVTMYAVTILGVGLVLFGLCYLAYRYKKAFGIPLLIVSLVILTITSIGYYQLQKMPLGSYDLHISALKIFYLCDGMIIILAFCFNTSYETANILLFCFLQPGLILILCISIFNLQSKLKKFKSSNRLAN